MSDFWRQRTKSLENDLGFCRNEINRLRSHIDDRDKSIRALEQEVADLEAVIQAFIDGTIEPPRPLTPEEIEACRIAAEETP